MVRLVVRSDRIELAGPSPPWISSERLQAVHADWVDWLQRVDSSAAARIMSVGYVLRIGRRPQAAGEAPSLGDLLTPTIVGESHQHFLLPYQRVGRDWLLSEKSRLLADEMGLGKTVQCVAALATLSRKLTRPLCCLVVCPTSVVSGWCDHVYRFGEDLWSHPEGEIKNLGLTHVCVASIARLPRRPEIFNKKWDVLIVDEAHRARNEGTLLQDSVLSIEATRRWFLTGTPLERDSKDLVTMLRGLGVRGFETSSHAYSLNELHGALSRVSLRRTRDQANLSLPSSTRRVVVVEMTPEQLAADREVRVSASRGQIGLLAAVSQLRTIADIAPGSGASGKLDFCVDEIRRRLLNSEKVVVFSFTLEPLCALEKRLCSWGSDSAFWLSGEMNASERQHSIEAFSNTKRASVMLASSRACAEGVTLTAASCAILINEWWNPSTNSQIAGRIIRIGQLREAEVIVLRSRGSIDERLREIVNEKSVMLDDLLKRLERGSDRDLSPLERSVIKDALG